MLVGFRYTALLVFGLQSVAFANSAAVSQYLSDATPFKLGRQMLRTFSAPLTADEEAECLKFLKRTFEDDKSEYGRTRQNDLADWLLYQPQHVNACTAVILEVIADENADIRWREFCVQKLALALDQSALRRDSADQCLAALIEKAGDPRISFSGTALLGLYSLSKKPVPLVETEEVVRLAEHVLSVASFPNANKVTALQVAGLSGSEAALSMARNFIADRSVAMQLRVSAIALLGRKGNESDIPVLESLTENLDFRLRKAAEAAVRNLNS